MCKYGIKNYSLIRLDFSVEAFSIFSSEKSTCKWHKIRRRQHNFFSSLNSKKIKLSNLHACVNNIKIFTFIPFNIKKNYNKSFSKFDKGFQRKFIILSGSRCNSFKKTISDIFRANNFFLNYYKTMSQIFTHFLD